MSAQKYRFRHLVQAGVDYEDRDATDPNKQGYMLAQQDPGASDAAPVLVESRDGEGTIGEIATLLRQRKLQPRDLVDLGRGWETIADTVELGQLAASIPQKIKIPEFVWFLVGWFGIGIAIWATGVRASEGIPLWLASFMLPLLAWMMISQNRRKTGPTPTVESKPFDPNDPS